MQITTTQAVILAAGTGSRLGGASNGRPKCLLEVGGRSLLRHHLAALNEIGVERILVVAGHGADQVMAETSHSGVVQFNDIYAQTNSLYSLWLARQWIAGSLMVINADVLATPQIYHRVAKEEGSVVAFDSESGSEEEEMKVRFEAGRLEAINKVMGPDRSHGENLGILKFDPAGAKALLEEANRIVSAGRLMEWAPAAVDRIARRIPIRGVDVRGLPWTEIDFPEDLKRARQEVWPAIAARTAAANGAQRSGLNGHHPLSFTKLPA